LERLKSLNIDLINFSSYKPVNEPSQAWIDFYSEYKDFITENNKLPGKREGRLYRWRRRQVQAKA